MEYPPCISEVSPEYLRSIDESGTVDNAFCFAPE